MKRRDVLTVGRLFLELVLALPASEAAFAADIEIPPAMSCQFVMPMQVERRGHVSGAAPDPGAER